MKITIGKKFEQVIDWCDKNESVFNASKTKELIFDFNRRSTCQYPVFVQETTVEIVQKYKYLGFVIDDQLKWRDNVNMLYRKWQKRLYFVTTFQLDKDLLYLFCNSVVHSVIIGAFDNYKVIGHVCLFVIVYRVIVSVDLSVCMFLIVAWRL